MPASTPLPDTSTSATSSVLPSSERVATRKSPENDAPPAERSTTSACQPSGRAGISPWAVSRSRRSTSIESPRVPCTPSRPRERASRCTIAAVAATTSTAPGDTRGSVPARDLQHDHRRDDEVEQEQAAHREQEAAGQRPRPARADSGNQVRFTRNRAPSAGSAQAQGHQGEPVRVQHVPPDPGPGPPPDGLPARGGSDGSAAMAHDSSERDAASPDDRDLDEAICAGPRDRRSGRHLP